MTLARSDAPAPRDTAPFGLLAAGLGVAGVALGLLLWSRFGESVYATSLVSAFLACF